MNRSLATLLFLVLVVCPMLLGGCVSPPAMSKNPADNFNPAMTAHQKALRTARNGG